MATDRNAKFLIKHFSLADDRTVSVYLLNPGEFFDGFGGSSRGLVVGKTASLVTRDLGPMGCIDHEYDIADQRAWAWIFSLAAQCTPYGKAIGVLRAVADADDNLHVRTPRAAARAFLREVGEKF